MDFDKETGLGKEVLDSVRLHLICGVHSKVVTAARASHRHADEKKYLEHMVRDTLALGFEMHGLAGDKNYSSKTILQFLADLGITPYMTFKKNAVKSRKVEDSAWNESLEKYRGREEEVMRNYHNRSLVETTNSSIKGKFGKSLASIKMIAQYNEALIKVICHNICVWNKYSHRLGILPTYKCESSNIKS